MNVSGINYTPITFCSALVLIFMRYMIAWVNVLSLMSGLGIRENLYPEKNCINKVDNVLFALLESRLL